MIWITANLLAPFMTVINHALVVAAMTLNLLLGGMGTHSRHVPIVQLSVTEAQGEAGVRSLSFLVSVNPDRGARLQG